ncbi:MAG: trypsin-like peptidase domain-containing protein [Lachnospiraceae bacterium]|jgi:serine protease Do|nr:trypsin-like peptidase domain-containing protein [Lachnospiraceae bacterium]MDD3616110.1 trypsin-like peptidase domain-containing protein [Lachnospiraceae bacterium]
MSEYGDYNFNDNGKYDFRDENYVTPMNQKSPKKKRNNTYMKWVKRIGAVTLSAVLFGGVAGGAFQAVKYLTAAPAAATASTQSGNSSSSLIKTAATSGGSTSTGSLDVSSIAENAMPSIVSITNKSVQEVQSYFSMFGQGGGTQEQETESVGSGIIIGQNDSELLIVTNYHVIESADTLTASFIDDQAYEANVKGTDPDNDLAVIAVSLDSISDDTMSQIAVATMATDEDAVKVGEQVVAIGNALGYGQSVTTGIVSATERSLTTTTEDGTQAAQDAAADSTAENTYIQTDAAINPGNSGGALLNMSGEVIGINSAKLASTEIEGMGYAIPVSRVSDIIENLMNQTTKTKLSTDEQGSIGIKGLSVTEDIQQAYSIPAGVYVSEVTKGGAAEAAGITANSVITSFDGTTITDISQLQDLLQYYAEGTKVEVKLQVPDGDTYIEKTVTVTLGKAVSSDDTQQNDSQSDAQSGNSGLQSGLTQSYGGYIR